MSTKLDSQRWQAESDASTMATYQEIINDKPRMRRAIQIAKQQAANLNKRATAMQNVANTKTSSARKSGKTK